MQVLLLGGTGFLGQAISQDAIARGHRLTCLARGNGDVIDGATFIRADRDQDDALEPVVNQQWDAVIDLTSHPIHAKRAVRDVDSKHWVYISSSSVYTRGDVLEQD